jgi:hypothetical protein
MSEATKLNTGGAMNRWPMLRVMLTAHGWFVLIGWVVLAVVTAAVTLGISIWSHVDYSTWNYAATQVSRWVVLGLGYDAITTYLRLHVAHGRTRGDFLRQLWLYLVGLAVIVTSLLTVGYVVERGVYALAGWQPRLQAVARLFESTGDVLGIFGGLALMVLLWTTAGVLAGAAFARHVLLGLAVIPLGLLIITPTEILVGEVGVPLFRDTVHSLGLTTVEGFGIGVAAIAVGCVAIWGILRDIPVRPKVT